MLARACLQPSPKLTVPAFNHQAGGAGKIAKALSAIDFGSGRERGMRSYQREAYQEQQQKKAADAEPTEKEAAPVE